MGYKLKLVKTTKKEDQENDRYISWFFGKAAIMSPLLLSLLFAFIGLTCWWASAGSFLLAYVLVLMQMAILGGMPAVYDYEYDRCRK